MREYGARGSDLGNICGTIKMIEGKSFDSPTMISFFGKAIVDNCCNVMGASATLC